MALIYANHKPGFPQENLVYGLEFAMSEKQILPTVKTKRNRATQGGSRMANHKPGFPQENLVYGLEKTTSEKQLLPTDKTLR
ncbi:MAG: hypothetical protein IPP06_13775 [Saprospiraceae bacterium]|nr:hypothetical protein [Candidatus Vicinibacter affinis]